MKTAYNYLFLLIFLISGSLLFEHSIKQDNDSFRSISSLEVDVYQDRIKPILDNRCVVCHSCYNSPCQLNLASFEGLERGGSKDDIYAFNALRAKKPTRMFVDAHTPKEWQEGWDFIPVVQRSPIKEVNLSKSLLWKMLEMKEEHPNLVGDFSSETSRSCPQMVERTKTRAGGRVKVKYTELKQFNEFKKEFAFAGMPYGLPKLEDSQLQDMKAWIESGSPGPEKKTEELPWALARQLEMWEIFLNRTSIKEKITSRYIYEHLAFAHIYIKNYEKKFFRLVRSKTKTGQIDEIATVRPYDDPGGEFYYRLREIKSTIVHKTHIVYEWSPEKLGRYIELFIDPVWENEKRLKLPSYESSKAANPFVTFEQMPIKSRYQFLLDDAQYHVMTFIRGPVCRGQVALNVIDDQFWVFFVDPDSDLTVKHPEFLKEHKELMTPPAARKSRLGLYNGIRKRQVKFREERSKLYDRHLPNGIGSEDIWDGDGFNDNAVLTVFRHFDSATVMRGAKGHIPKTVWVMDYPIFEDIYYNLVAGYNVYGALVHQLTTRLYMENSRINSQDFFIDLLPQEARIPIRESFSLNNKGLGESSYNSDFYQMFPSLYMGGDAGKKMKYRFPYYGLARDTKEKYETKAYKREILDNILNKRMNSVVRGEKDKINCCDNGIVFQEFASKDISSKSELEEHFKNISGVRGEFAQVMPELSLLRVKRDGAEDLVYTIVRNTAHYNVNYLFNEQSRLRPSHNTINIYPGFVGSYPNYFYTVSLENSGEFVKELSNLKPKDNSYKSFVTKYGVNRLDDNFWNEFDWFQQKFYQEQPIRAGILDLNRYQND